VTRVDFYILSAEGGTDAVVAAARLCDKAVSAGHSVYAAVPDAARLDALDDLLWTQRQGSFIAHERFVRTPPTAPLPKVLLGESEPPEGWQDVLLNLGQQVPPFFSRFERVLEIVPGDAESRAACRERFRFYRERGYELKTFEQTAEGSWQLKA
jgi:DNA polymerase-3 subunit chi